MRDRPIRPNRLVPLVGGFLAVVLTLQGCEQAGPSSEASDMLSAPRHERIEVFRLGGVEPAEPEMFDYSPHLVVDHSERLYILHRSRGDVAVFEPDGEFLHWIHGGRGQGPGEFTFPVRMGFVGDTLWVRNYSPPRISRFRADGTHLGTETVQLPKAFPTMVGAQGVSGYLEGGRAWVEPDGPPAAMREGEHAEAALELAARAIDEEERDTVVTWRSNRGRLRGLTFDPIPEPPFFSVAPDGSGIVVAEWTDEAPESLLLRVVQPDGADGWRQELTVHPDPIPAAEHDSLIAAGQERVQLLREGLFEQGLSPVEVPEVPTPDEARASIHLPAHRPPIRDVRLGVDGTIWLELDATSEGATWLAMDPDSGALLTVTLPPNAEFGQATRTSLWYSESDDLGVPWVVKARISPPTEETVP